jgi:hypothetical protein
MHLVFIFDAAHVATYGIMGTVRSSARDYSTSWLPFARLPDTCLHPSLVTPQKLESIDDPYNLFIQSQSAG